MKKNNLPMILRGFDSCKKYADGTISMSYPDVVIACIEHIKLEVFRVIEAALVKYDNNMKDYSW